MMYTRFFLVLAMLCINNLLKLVYAQQIDIEKIGKNTKQSFKKKIQVKYSGNVSLNTVLYNGNASSGREPFNYFLTGNCNVSVANISIPVSFNFTNSGFSYNYQFPRPPSRLSLHPKYKSVTAHIGDISMNFSPYTFNGYLFRGVGFDLKPKGNFSYSAFYGQLQKAVPFERATALKSSTIAAYKRLGFGMKVNFDKGKFKWGLSLFRATDMINSLNEKPDSAAIYPQDNTALGIETDFPLFSNVQLKVQYGISVLTRDKRTDLLSDSLSSNFFYKLTKARLSTNIYHAINAQLNYIIGTSQIGVGLERIAPNYQTLGAYYFNNDLQNITANFAQNLFKGKVTFSANVGLQQDNLDKKKASSSNRFVSSINANWSASQRLNISSQYSNFRSFTNIRPQFQYINQLTPFDHLDTLNYYQLSQNANVNINYVISKAKDAPKNLNINLSLQDAFDEQGGVIAKGNSSQFYNLATSYSQTATAKNLTWVTALNATYNTIANNNIITVGPTINLTKGFLKNELRTTGSVSYNQTSGARSGNAKIVSLRMNGTYIFRKKHNISLSAVSMFRTSPTPPRLQRDITGTFNYNYSL